MIFMTGMYNWDDGDPLFTLLTSLATANSLTIIGLYA